MPNQQTVEIVKTICTCVAPMFSAFAWWVSHRSNRNTKLNGATARDTNKKVVELNHRLNGRLDAFIADIKREAHEAGRLAGREEIRLAAQNKLVEIDGDERSTKETP